jgi:tetratricopeptide (TPR) repeat protein
MSWQNWAHEFLARMNRRRLYCHLFCWGLFLPGVSLRGGEAPARAANGASEFETRLAGLQARIARDPTNTTLLFQAGDLCFDQGAGGDHHAVDLAEDYFRRLLSREETNALARVMLGSTLTMQGRDAFWPTAKLRHVREGIRSMDAAVAQDPQNARVRLERAVNNFHMPQFLDREAIVQADLEWLWTRAQSPSDVLTAAQKQSIAWYYGLYLKKHRQAEQAEAIWTQAIPYAPDSAVARDIRQELRGKLKGGD